MEGIRNHDLYSPVEELLPREYLVYGAAVIFYLLRDIPTAQEERFVSGCQCNLYPTNVIRWKRLEHDFDGVNRHPLEGESMCVP